MYVLTYMYMFSIQHDIYIDRHSAGPVRINVDISHESRAHKLTHHFAGIGCKCHFDHKNRINLL